MVMSDFHPLLEFPTIKFMMLHNLSASSRLYTKFYLLFPVTQTTAVNNFTDIHKQTQTQTDRHKQTQTDTHTQTQIDGWGAERRQVEQLITHDSLASLRTQW